MFGSEVSHEALTQRYRWHGGPCGGPLAGIMCALSESYVTGPANIRGGGQDVASAASCVDSGSGPRGGDEERRN